MVEGSSSFLVCPVCYSNGIDWEYNPKNGLGRAYCTECDCMGPRVKTEYNVAENAKWKMQALNKWWNLFTVR